MLLLWYTIKKICKAHQNRIYAMYNLCGVNVKINKKIIILLMVLVLVVRCVVQYIAFNFKYTSDISYKDYVVKITKIKKDEEEKFSAEAKLCEGNSCKDKVILNVYDTPSASIAVGDKVYVKAKLVIPELLNNPGEFNYKRYLNSCGIYATLTVKTVEKVDNTERFVRVQDKIYGKVQKALPDTYANLLSAMIYGKTEGLDTTIQNNFKKIGVSHVISVSGTNLAIVIGILEYIFRKLRFNKKVKIPLEIVFTVAFGVIAGLGYSILRAVICSVIGSICEICGKKIKGVKKLFLSLYITLLINPYAIFNVSLQLSYTATLGIMIYCSKIERKLKKMLNLTETKKKILWQKRFLMYILKGIIQTISITVSAQILALPIQIITFGSLAVMSVLSNILISPIVTLCICLGTISIVLSFVPFVSVLVFKLVLPLFWLLIKMSELLAKVAPEVNVPHQHQIVWFAYYSVIFIFLVLDRYFKEKVKIKGRYIVKNIVIKGIIIFIFVLLIVFSNIYTIYLDNYFCFFNVGQGNMCYLRYDQKNILLDCGSTKEFTATSTIDSFLETMNISVIHAICISHFHQDHVNAVVSLIEKYTVEEIYFTPTTADVKLYQEIQKEAAEHGTVLKEVYAGDILQFGALSVQVLFPTYNVAQDTSLDLNAKSTVYKIEINEKVYLFMGDSGEIAENFLIKDQKLKNIYLLVVGHHGSKTSTSEEFIQELKPSVSIISSKKSVYGHPAERVTQVLKKYNSQILITENLGAIKIKI